MNKRLWIVFAVLVLAAIGGLVYWKKSTITEVSVDGLDAKKLLTIDDVGKGEIPDHYFGNKDSKVIVIEYEDYACVHCAQLASTFDKITNDYQEDVLFIYRNFSLGYPNSIVSESAAEAAYLLGGEEAYWKMHALLFQDESTWTGQAVPFDQRNELLSGFAKEIGVDVDKFLSTIEDRRGNGIQTKLDRDKKLGIDADVSGTPSWFIDGKKIDEMSDSAIRKALDEALGKAKN
jgi:protein-disulfide isomerase